MNPGFHRGLGVRLREAARYLTERGVRTVGVAMHQALLGAGIWVIEGLDQPGVEPGEHELIRLPLKVEDGAYARALLRR